ncbi:hypothetical protein HGRIS_012449 [Hohenbuehelia grisea]|uniref:Uncharacterized protein n=1 Tax=Hohenbuehelia grisea TaxID=104357 RepID=A0ABR3ISB5_9AGAR
MWMWFSSWADWRPHTDLYIKSRQHRFPGLGLSLTAIRISIYLVFRLNDNLLSKLFSFQGYELVRRLLAFATRPMENGDVLLPARIFLSLYSILRGNDRKCAIPNIRRTLGNGAHSDGEGLYPLSPSEKPRQ